MTITAIICEFNPFHNGHKYLIEQAKKMTHCDAVLCIMSGNFAQRAEPMIIDKYSRSSIALNNGADVIIELPLAFATSDAKIFALGAVTVLNKIKEIKYLVFGAENANIDELSKLAKLYNDESQIFQLALKKYLNMGYSYPKSHYLALIESQNEDMHCTMSDIVLSKPNNMLAIEYLKALTDTKSIIQPMAVKRINNNYNDTMLSGTFSSATAIRQALSNNNTNSLKDAVPYDPNEYFALSHSNIESYNDILLYNLRNMKGSYAEEIYSYSSNLYAKIQKSLDNVFSLNELIEKVKNKSVTLAHIKRFILQNSLGVTDEVVNNALKMPVSRVLGIKKSFLSYTKIFESDCFITRNSKLVSNEYINLEKKSDLLYSIYLQRPIFSANRELIKI